MKILFQMLCKRRVDWDQLLSEDLLKNWSEIILDLSKAEPISVERCYFSIGEECLKTKVSLQGFCDASSSAYAAVIYLRVEGKRGCHTKLLASKTRVAPIATQTIPRLELLSALLLARLINHVEKTLAPEITLSEPTCYTDSRVALYWIKGSNKEWKQFVENRVVEIHRLVPEKYWRHCPGHQNQADLPSRGMSPLALKTNSLWWRGPEWLSYTANNMEEEITELSMPEECASEMKKNERTRILLVSEKNYIGSVFQVNSYHSLIKLLRVTAIVLRVVRRSTPAPSITSQEVVEAEKLWLLDAQSSLSQEAHFEQWSKQFGLFHDQDGILRCQGRLGNSDLPYETKHPILLNPKHHLCELIIKDCHERVKHNGVQDTLTQLRARFWIIKGRSHVRKFIQHCYICRKFESKPYNLPTSPSLPDFRVTQSPPFSCTGLDFAGPLQVRPSNGDEPTKVWICIYTCCVIRAVHLELVSDLTTPTFLNSFRRFTARHGVPYRVVSDNAKTFKAAAAILRETLSHPHTQQYFADSHIQFQWSFNIEKAPWWGGFFERLVKSVKHCLKKIFGNASLTYDELFTSLTEVESVLNSRPLSVIVADDFEEPLTPSHLLNGRRLLNLPSYPRPTDPDYTTRVKATDLTKRMQYLDRTLTHFWRRWSSEYLTELRECHRYLKFGKQSTSRVPVVGEGVVVYDQDCPRGQWKTAVIEQTFKGSDGLISGALIRVHDKGGHLTRLRRPISHLYPLEIHIEETPMSSNHDMQRRRSQRAAAQVARENIRGIHDFEQDS